MPERTRHLAFVVCLASTACAGGNADAPTPSTAAASTHMHTATNPAATFDRYRTFSFGPSEGAPVGYHVAARSAEVQSRLQPLIAAALTHKGYVLASGKGDVYIMYGSGQRDLSTSEPSDDIRSRNVTVGAGWSPDDETADFVEGSLVIDAFDGAERKWVWHGASRGTINPDRIDDQQLQRAVEALIASFPTQKTSGQGGP
jgi:hypothetical protein